MAQRAQADPPSGSTLQARRSRLNEVRRRTRPMGDFNDQASLERIIYSIVQRLNAQGEKREKRPLKRSSTQNS